MRQEAALFGGELSYHFYFADFFSCESGIMAMLLVLQAAARSGASLASLVEPLRKYAPTGETNFPAADLRGAMERVEAQFQDSSVSHLDGLSVDYDDWWFNLRPSNTEPLLRLNLEARTRALMEEKLALLEGLLKRGARRDHRARRSPQEKRDDALP